MNVKKKKKQFCIFTFYSRRGAGNVTEDPESSDQSCSLSSQNIFHILNSSVKNTRVKNVHYICI